MNAAIMLQYWHGLGWGEKEKKMRVSMHICGISSYLNIYTLKWTYRPKLFDILCAFLTDSVGFAEKGKFFH